MNSRKYYVLIDKSPVEVTEEVYRAYKRPAWRERKRRQVRVEMELSLDLFIENGLDMPSAQLPIDDVVGDKLLYDTLHEALAELSAEERNLIDVMYFNGLSEREAAQALNLPRNTFVYRKNRILEKLKRIMKNF